MVNVLELIRKKAAMKTLYEEDEDMDFTFGGNFDDAFSAGCDEGEILMARTLLPIMEKNLKEAFKETSDG